MAKPKDPDAESRRAAHRRKKQLEKAQRHEIKQSVYKASTARAHKRPPPLPRKGTAKASAVEMLSSFMELSVNILHEALYAEIVTETTNEDGTVTETRTPDLKTRRQAANYVIDKVAAAEGTYLPEGLGVDADIDVLETGRRMLDLVLNGQLSIEAGVKVFGLLEKQASLQGLNELDELRKMVEQLTGDGAKVINGVPGGDQHPAWLKLAQNKPQETH